jgi:sulfur-oxidizing protein SoxA
MSILISRSFPFPLWGMVGMGALATLTLTSLLMAQTQAQDPRRSGFQDMAPSTQAMQREDTANPGMLTVQDGEALWSKPTGASGKSCVACHAAAASSMRGVAARYPAFDAALERPVTLSQRINQCRQRHQQAAPLKPESQDLLALEAFIALQSRGLPIAPPADPRMAPARARGQALWQQRIGQINLSCTQCHDAQAGRKLAGSLIPQAHPTGYPIYRLEWQGMGSLQRRIRGCMSGVRAEPYAFDARELVELEAYLAVRAKGMPLESPAVRP